MPLPVDPSFNCTYAPAGSVLKAALPLPAPPDLPVQLTALLANIPTGISPDQLLFPYLKYDLRTRYTWKNGNLQLPVAKTPAPIPPLSGFTSLGDTGGSSVLQTLPNESGNNQPIVKPLMPQYGESPSQPVSGSGSSSTGSSLSDRPASVNIQVHAPYGKKVVEFLIVRLGAQGVLPDPAPSNDNEILDDADVDIWAPVSTPDGQSFVWIARGKYVYSLSKPYWVTDGLVGGATPADNSALEDNFYPPSQYDDAIS